MLIGKWRRPLAVAVLLALLVPLLVTIPDVHGGDDDQYDMPEKRELEYPNLGSHLDQLVAGVEAGEASAEDAAGDTAIHQDQSVAVTIHLSGNMADVVTFLEDNGGDPRNAGEDYIEAYVPVTLLGSLSEQPGVIRVREIVLPEPDYGPITSQGVLAHLTTAWQNAGYSGRGIKVGIIDVGFEDFGSLMGTELPATVAARCYTDVGVFTQNLSDCEVRSSHGTAVAEAVMDIAPQVSLYIARPSSGADLQATADWMVSEGVSVINRSVSSSFDGPGDGTSPNSISPLKTVDRAVDGGITWVNSAGNYAQQTWFLRGRYSDPDRDGLVNFTERDEGITISLEAGDRITVQLRWDDSWRGATRNFDLGLWNNAARDYVVVGADPQSGGAGHDPYERLTYLVPEGAGGSYALFVEHVSGSVPDWIQLIVFGDVSHIQHYTRNGSITSPGESANSGMLAVGATPWYYPHTIEHYSSRGPTPDERAKPDIVGADCGASATYPEKVESRPGCWFSGTSQAAPHVAGLAALVRQRFPDYTPEQIADYLKENAQQREEADFNNTWGHGFAQLPQLEVAPPPGPTPTDPCGQTITGDGNVSGQWAEGCQSEVSDRGYARYYTFTQGSESVVTITLESQDADTYLYLWAGQARSGELACSECENDDDGGTTRSQIQATLAAGTYTIEATTYDPGETGSFTLTVAGLGAVGATPGPEPGGDCGETLSGDGSVSGEWAQGCDSEAEGRGYARYYTFTQGSESVVTITLESQDADTYLYLRAGQARSGELACSECENDDDGGTTRSQIQATLAAGTYTIEATTYDPGETGSFTLTVAGLGAVGATPGPEPGGDCGETLSGDGSVSGEWAQGCDSEAEGRGYARYYTFTQGSESVVTITLESQDADTYLYLRAGQARSGELACSECENDDDGGTTRSQIQATLAAGTYTIEATTYGEGETGSFTLAISGTHG